MKRLLLFFLLVLFGTRVFAQPSDGQSALQQAAGIMGALEKSNSFAESLAAADLNVLPVGVKRVQGNVAVTLAIDKAKFRGNYTELNVYAKLVLPQKDAQSKPTTLFFGGQGIKLSNDGSIIGDARLELLDTISIPFNGDKMSLALLGSYDEKTGNFSSGTYISIDCFGFKELSLDAEVRFPTSMLRKVNSASGKVNPADMVVAGKFKTVVTDWNDILAEVTLPSFEVAGLDGYVFDLQKVALDFSDTKNSESTRFPSGYGQKYLIPGAESLWRGVFASELTLTLPRAFDKSDGTPVSFGAKNLLIDENGITGLFSAENVLDFASGDASGWSFSVNTFRLELEANKLTAAGFAGEIGLPVAKKDTRLAYDAMFGENNNYVMTVSPTDSLAFSIFNAKTVLLPNSWVKMHMKDGKFNPEAMLHGYMALGGVGDAKLKVPQLDFRSMHLTTSDPYINVEYLGYKGSASIGSSGFKISLDTLEFRSLGGGRVELRSGVAMSLAKDMFGGSTRIALLASRQGNRWEFDGTRLDEMKVKAEIAKTLTLKGTIGWMRDDPTYGEGFYGEMDVDIKPAKVNVKMRGMFGTVEDYKYWFMDGSATFPGTPIVGPLKINGFAGAVSQRMTGRGMVSTTTYIPDREAGLGLKAAVMLEFGKDALGSGQACFDIAFSRSGGLNYIGFYGYAKFASGKLNVVGANNLIGAYNKIIEKEKEFVKSGSLNKLTELKLYEPHKAAKEVNPMPDTLRAAIKGALGIQYDFRNKTFHASTELYVNVANVLTGDGQNGKAGWGTIHIAPDEWYMHFGSPDDRIGLRLGLANLITVRTGSYLMTGSRIPPMPAPPREVADILGMDLDKLTLGRNIEELSTGKGFAFGADLAIRTGDLTFLMLYANFAAGMGFDVMMKDYGEMQCAETGQRIGMNGWYAMGQTYAYLQGELGVRVHLAFIKGRFPIIKGGTAAILQMGLPKPAFFRGVMAVKFNVLGGLVKGRVRFKLNLGDQCTPVIPGGSPIQMPMISDIDPADGDTAVSVFTSPETTFSTVVEKAFEAEGTNGESNTYRIKLKSFTVKDKNGAEIKGRLRWNRDMNAVTFHSKDVLPPNQELTARVEVGFEQLNGGSWRTVVTSGKEAIESKEIKFTTGTAPDNILLDNVLHCYPVADQKYFLTEESSKGYVQLDKGQPYLFERGFGYKLIFTGDNKKSAECEFTYNDAENRIEYSIPALEKARKYALQLVYTPDPTKVAASEKPAETQQEIADGEDDMVTTENRTASAGLNASGQKSILDYGFTTSRWATFRDKVNSIDLSGRSIAEDAGISYRFIYEVEADEAFDETELVGIRHSAQSPLVKPHAALREPYFTETVDPLVYAGYPFGGNIRLNYRVDSEIGVPPIRSVFVYPPYLDMIREGNAPRKFIFPFSFETTIVVERDFVELRNQVANNQPNVSGEVYDRFIRGRLPFLKYGKYKVVLRYVLPDGTETSATDFYFYNHLKFNK